MALHASSANGRPSVKGRPSALTVPTSWERERRYIVGGRRDAGQESACVHSCEASLGHFVAPQGSCPNLLSIQRLSADPGLGRTRLGWPSALIRMPFGRCYAWPEVPRRTRSVGRISPLFEGERSDRDAAVCPPSSRLLVRATTADAGGNRPARSVRNKCRDFASARLYIY